MIVKFLLIIISFLLTVPSFAQKEDTVSIHYKTLERERLWQDFGNQLYQNPALNYYRFTSNLSTLSIQGNLNEQYQYLQAEEGDKWKGFRVNAQSYIHLTDASCIWGNAYYDNGIRENVQWNENSDYDKLYPYVAADTIGGEMKSGTYYFKGGYSHHHDKWTFGAEFFYRALMEYRSVDPRPKNTVADLQGVFGVSYEIVPSYAIALKAEANKYKQNSSIKYYNELGVSKTYHLQGLGTSYVRFDGTRNAINYQGKIFGIGLDLLPISVNKGAFSSILYNYSTYDKILPSLNDITLNRIKEDLFKGELGWSNSTKIQDWGIKGQTEYCNRKGDEYIYGDASGNIYPHLATNEGYNRKTFNGSVIAFYEQKARKNWIWGGTCEIGYSTCKENHYSSKNQMKYNSMDFALTAVSHWMWKRHRLDAEIGGSYQKSQDANLRLNTTTTPKADQIIERNFNLLSSDPIGYHLSAKWSELFLKNKIIYIECIWAQKRYSDQYNGYSLLANIGFSF